MSAEYKPENYSSVSPYIIVENASETIDFLVNVFDAEDLRRSPYDTGRLMHAEVRIGDSVLMLADSVENWPPVPGYVHIYVPDVDVTYQKALTYGVESIQEPKKNDEEADRRGGVRDSNGNTWWIATKVE